MGPKTDVIVKLALVFFISLLSFSIGTFVGKKYSDNQHKLASMEGAEKPEHSEAAAEGEEAHGEAKHEATAEHGEGEAAREVASEHGEKAENGEEAHGEKAAHGEAEAEHGAKNAHATASSKSEKLTDEEIKKLAEEFVADDKAPETAHHGEEAHGEATKHGETAKHGEAAKHGETAKHGEEAHGETAKHEAPAKARGTKTAATAHEAEAHAEPLAAAKKMTEKVNAEERKPSSIPKNVGQYEVGKFTVQVASFASEGEAKSKSAELKGQGFSAFFFPAEVKGKTWYRVSVGMFATEKEAKEYKTDLMAKAKLDSAIVQKIQAK